MTRVGLGKPHHKLEAWQQSMALVTKVYEETQLLIGVNLGMLRSDHEIFEALERVSKLVLGLRKSIQI